MRPGFLERYISHARHVARTLLAVTALHSVPAMADSTQPAEDGFSPQEDQYDEPARSRIDAWRDLISSGQHLDDAEKLQQVNSFFNGIAFANDIDHWGVEDYWATPLQLITSNAGDCEDFSIAKYFTLREMGIAADNLRLTYVKAIRLDQAHMVLVYLHEGLPEPMVLDNLTTQILRISQRDDLVPVYSFNAEGLWLARDSGEDKRVGNPERLSRWQEVVSRINDERLATAAGTAAR